MDREAFFKGQSESLQKALTKQGVPLKPKHARRIILGTHHEKSCSIFWNNLSRIPLEKNNFLTWKFCHLLHKMIRDGHENVLAESLNHKTSISKLGDHWKQQISSEYREANTQYCKMLCERLEFHKKYPQIRGNLSLAPRSAQTDVDAFTTSIDMLDLMDNLLLLQKKVLNTLENLSFSALVPQGQMLLAPLILESFYYRLSLLLFPMKKMRNSNARTVVLDTSKLYDLLVKLLFHLHSVHHPDALVELRERFRIVFLQTKEFYEETGKLQYFKYLVTVPLLPATAPNFLFASEIERYEAPLASEIGADFDDGRSVSISDLSVYDLDEIYAVPNQLQQHARKQEQIYDTPFEYSPSATENLHADCIARVAKAERERDEATARYRELEIKYQRALQLLMERGLGDAANVARM